MRLLSRLSAYGLLVGFWLAIPAAFLAISIFVDIQRENRDFTQTAAAVYGEWVAKTQAKRIAAEALASGWSWMEAVADADPSRLGGEAANLAAADGDILQIAVLRDVRGEPGGSVSPESLSWDARSVREFQVLYRRVADARGESNDIPAPRLWSLLAACALSHGSAEDRVCARIETQPGHLAAGVLLRQMGQPKVAPAWAAIVFRLPEAGAVLDRQGMSLTLFDTAGGYLLSPVSRSGPPTSEWETLLFPQLSYRTHIKELGVRLELEQQLGFQILDWSRLRTIVCGSVVLLGFLLTLAALYFRSERRLRDEGNRLFRLANFDALTDLPNRLLFGNRLEQAIVAASRTGQPLALLYLDLDGFKMVNDFYGHQIGDLVLQRAARIFRHCVRDMDTVARLGGDEFVILLQDVAGLHGAELVSRKIKRAFLRTAPDNSRLRNLPMLGTSIGIAMYPKDGDTPAELLKAADRSMYRDKAVGKEQTALMAQTVAD